jgi:hypothetical protein
MTFRRNKLDRFLVGFARRGSRSMAASSISSHSRPADGDSQKGLAVADERRIVTHADAHTPGATTEPRAAPDGRREARRPLATAIDPALGRRAREYAIATGVSLATVLEQALLEYLDVRGSTPGLGPLARQRRGTGRPSQERLAQQKAQLDALKKRRGRPLVT